MTASTCPLVSHLTEQVKLEIYRTLEGQVLAIADVINWLELVNA